MISDNLMLNLKSRGNDDKDKTLYKSQTYKYSSLWNKDKLQQYPFQSGNQI